MGKLGGGEVGEGWGDGVGRNGGLYLEGEVKITEVGVSV